MNKQKFFNIAIVLIMFTSLVLPGSNQVLAMPSSPVDETKIPHYFGPYSNYANSPFTLASADVQITGDGTGAMATATVGANGTITAIDITNPGSGYTNAAVSITGTGTGANATANVTLSGIVSSITVDSPGAGYTQPVVNISGGTGTGTTTPFGNSLVDRGYATDYNTNVVPASVSPLASKVYNATIGNATGGTFTLTVDGVTTGTIAWNAAATDVETALSAVGVTATVTGSGSVADPWVIVFAAAPASVSIDSTLLTQIVAATGFSATAAPTDTYSVNVGSATGGSFTLTVDGLTTAPIAWNAAAIDVETALSTAGVAATVTGSGTIADSWVIVFAVVPSSVTIDPSGLTQAVTDVGVTPPADGTIVTFNVTVGSASGGTFTLTVDSTTTGAIAWNAAATDVQTALSNAGVAATVIGSGSVADPWVITFATAPATFTLDNTLLTQGVTDASVAGLPSRFYNVTVGNADGGSFTLTVDGLTTAPIAWSALAADVQSALTTAGISVTSVTGSGSVADPWVITFTTAPTSVSIDGALLTQTVAATGASAVAAPTDTYSVTIGTATGGTFTLTVDVTTSAPIAWNAAGADVATAVGASSATGSGSIADPWVITFASAPTSVSIDGALLTQVPPVLVVLATPLPAGYLTSFETWNQATAGGSLTPSAGNMFNAYVLRPTGITDQYTVVFDSGTKTVPQLTVAGVSEQDSWPVGNVTVQAGDVIAFYGAGIPVDIVSTGTDLLYYPSPAAPVQGTTITVNSTAYPLYPQARTYSFGATVLDMSNPNAPTAATATAYGGVDKVTLTNPGSGYTFPTVDFDLPDDPNGIQATAYANYDQTMGSITGIVVVNPGSGYASAPKVVIRDGTIYAPVNGGSGATATATLSIQSVQMVTYGSGYTSAPSVTFNDAAGTPSQVAAATAHLSAGGVTSINLLSGGSGYLTQGGIKKFQDGLPVLCDPSIGWANCTDNNLGQHIQIAVPDTTTFTTANLHGPDADFYVIALVQHRERMSSSLPVQGTLLREYVQLETPANASWSKHIALQNDLLNGTSVPALMPDGSQAYAVDDPHFMGPIISATKDRPVRILFYNLLPTGSNGDLFFPVDTTFMGSGEGPMNGMMAPMDMGSVMDGVRNPACGETSKDRSMCFAETRAAIHLHGGITPWISDGSPHQWITPANEQTGWPQGVAVREVPDMVGGAQPAGIPDCSSTTDGCTTFYYTNQQSARLLFYHDHAWGITRLNVYAGEAAGYLITDSTEQKLFGKNGLFPDLGTGIPLVVQDRTFVPSPAQMAQQDPTWDYSRWGKEGDLWYEHVYMPAQNPGDPSGMSAFGRWMYGPWFWPPSTPTYGPIANPYYNMDPKGPDGIRGTADDWSTPLAKPCNLDDPSTWQYDTDPFCEPPQIPGTPNNSAGMEQFNDTPIVNGTAYPTTTVEPKAYRFRILNAANDRFWNLQWYVADSTGTEVALKASEVAAAQTDPNVFPTPDTTLSPAGPSWIQIGTESGFLPAPVVVPNQPITWIIDPTRFDFGNVDKHALLVAPAERADVIVDFSAFAGKTLILYNDAPAAFPARVASYDYYTGGPDLSPAGAPSTLPGYGPNTRTIMQVKVAANAPAPAFNLSSLQAAFRHQADGSGVFESGQNPIIVGQAAYNSAYGTSFTSAGDCTDPTGTNKCDGFARINQQGSDTFRFDTLRGNQVGVTIQPKAIHDEMNATNFEAYGRMSGNIGVEAVPATPALQNVVLYPFVNPPTELFDATNLPTSDKVTPIAVGSDGTEIWKITHNGVDTHPIHFHLYDVQVLNRVTWDNIIIPPDPNELGWKDTVRVSPLEDTYFAIRPIIPVLPFEIPNSIRPLNPMMPLGDTSMFNSTDPNGNPSNPVVNQLVNFGWEYMLHCHILSHEEMDMMRPVIVAMPPIAPDGLSYAIGKKNDLTITFNDNSISETSFVLQRTIDGITWTDVATSVSPLDQPNAHQPGLTLTDTTFKKNTVYGYRVVALNTVGYGAEFPSMTVQSPSIMILAGDAPLTAPLAPTNLTAILAAGPQINLSWTDNATNETSFIIERSVNGGAFTLLTSVPANNNTGTVTYADPSILPGNTYAYQVYAANLAGPSTYTNMATVDVPPAPAAPATFTATGGTRAVTLNWTVLNTTNLTGFTIQISSNATFTAGLASVNIASTTATSYTYTWSRLSRNTTYYFRIQANNGLVSSGWVTAFATTLP